MKLVYSADLHAPASDAPYRRLADVAAARGCALVAVAGDLLDIFGKNFGGQQHSASGWLRALAAQVPHLAVCSGNHETDGAHGSAWLGRAAASVPAGNLLGDGGQTVLPEGMIVSVCPWWNIPTWGLAQLYSLRTQAEAVWAAGRKLADQHPGLPWTVLHHQPPEGSRVALGGSDDEDDTGLGGGGFWCAEWVRHYQPDFLLSGHLHQAPLVDGGAWAERVGATWCFNPGRGHASGSRMVEVDAGRRVARWLDPDGEELDRIALPAKLLAGTPEPVLS